MVSCSFVSFLQEIIEFQDEANLELVLKVLQQMCEGQSTVLQNYLRVQTENLHTINLVSEIVELLHVLVEGLDNKTMPLVVQVCCKNASLDAFVIVLHITDHGHTC